MKLGSGRYNVQDLKSRIRLLCGLIYKHAPYISVLNPSKSTPNPRAASGLSRVTSTHPEPPLLYRESVAYNPLMTGHRAQSASFPEVSQSVYLSKLTAVDSKQSTSRKSASVLVSRLDHGTVGLVRSDRLVYLAQKPTEERIFLSYRCLASHANFIQKRRPQMANIMWMTTWTFRSLDIYILCFAS